MKLKQRIKTWLPALLALVLVCFYPCLFLFSQNAGEANAGDMLPFFGVFLLTALVGLLLTGLIVRNMSRAAFLTSLGMLVVINFSLMSRAIRKLLPWLEGEYLLALLCLLLLGLLVLLLRKKPDMTAGNIILALTFGVLSLISLMTAVPKLISAASYAPPPPHQASGMTLQGEKRNVYYLLFDEYGGDENLSAYFGFDNSEFYQELEDRGFSVSHSSRNTESCWTDTLVPNLLNLDYVTSDDMPEKVRRTYLENPYLLELFQGSGYQVNLINHRAFLRLRGVRELTSRQTEDTISQYLLDNSLFSKIPPLERFFSRKLFETYRDNYAGPLWNALDQLKGCARQTKGVPTLTVSYIQCPHAPFVFRADGSFPGKDKGWYWKDETLYPGQLQYLNTLILEAIDNIQAEDPDGVILLLSDHGARVPLHMVEQFGGPRFDAEKETPVMQSALMCAYVPGTDLDIEGDTGINVTRKVLNAAFGLELDMIPPAEGYVLPEIYNAKPAEQE